MGAVLKTRKHFFLDLEKLRVVKKIFNAKTDTEAVNKALDLAIDSTRIRKTLESIKGKGKIKDIYGRSSF
jgi:hypothetical protein